MGTSNLNHERDQGEEGHVLWVNIEPSSIRLHELQEDKLGSFVHVRSTNVLRTIAFQRNLFRTQPGQSMQLIPSLHTFGILFRNTSILFMKRIIDVRRNHLELTIDSKSTRDSVIRF